MSMLENYFMQHAFQETPDMINNKMLEAVVNGNYETTFNMIEKGADVNFSRTDNSALGLAAYKNYNDITTLLIKNGANLNLKNKILWTPIFSAIENNNLALYEFMREHGAMIDGTTRDLRNVLHISCQYLKNDDGIKILDILLKTPHICKYINNLDKEGHTPLSYAYQIEDEDIKLKAVGALLKYQAIIESKDSSIIHDEIKNDTNIVPEYSGLKKRKLGQV